MADSDDKTEKFAHTGENSLTICADGPITAVGDFELEDVPKDGTKSQITRASFCRCGHSKNKPFCDGSHRRVGFCEPGNFTSGGEGFPAPGGKVLVTRKKTGSLKFHGAVTVVSADGKDCWLSTRVKICRCGKTKTPPFCDDTHREIGFKE